MEIDCDVIRQDIKRILELEKIIAEKEKVEMGDSDCSQYNLLVRGIPSLSPEDIIKYCRAQRDVDEELEHAEGEIEELAGIINEFLPEEKGPLAYSKPTGNAQVQSALVNGLRELLLSYEKKRGEDGAALGKKIIGELGRRLEEECSPNLYARIMGHVQGTIDGATKSFGEAGSVKVGE